MTQENERVVEGITLGGVSAMITDLDKKVAGHNEQEPLDRIIDRLDRRAEELRAHVGPPRLPLVARLHRAVIWASGTTVVFGLGMLAGYHLWAGR